MTTEKKKSKKLSGDQEVAEFMNTLEHPLKPEIEEVRQIILSANEQITEHIKWKAPSFCIQNEDRITFHLQGKGYFQLIFHCGAKVKDTVPQQPLFEDTSYLLEWITNDRATIKFTDMNDVKTKQEQLKEIVSKWIEVTSI